LRLQEHAYHRRHYHLHGWHFDDHDHLGHYHERRRGRDVLERNFHRRRGPYRLSGVFFQYAQQLRAGGKVL
jgi:hypothetical protein